MRVAFHTLGCKVNQYETEAIKEAFVSRGAVVVQEDEEADAYIVNTCTVTNIADRKSRQYIRRMKALNPDAIVVVTGCYAQTSSDEVVSMPEVDIVIGNSLKSEICDRTFEAYADRNASKLVHVLERSDMDFYEDMGLVVSSETGLTRAYIKIQDGCDRFCSYCEIPYARGPVRSRPIDEIIKEAKLLIEQGYKEIVLTGINTALYGTERGADSSLEDVLARLDAIDADFRVRLSSLEPTVVDKEHVEKIIRFNKLCHHLHLSAQSGSTHILERMNRHYTSEDYLDIVRAIRDYDPLYGITTDVIVGFSGETEEDYQDSLSLIREAELSRVHAFRYSPRKGTAGAALDGVVSGRIKGERVDGLIAEGERAAKAFINKNRNVSHKVLAEERVGEYTTGYTDNYIKVYIEDPQGAIPLGEFCMVELGEIYEDGCIARLAEKGVSHE